MALGLLVALSSGAGGGGDVPGYDVILIAGQSNAVGYGYTIDTEVDVSTAYQYASSGDDADTVVLAVDPLHHPETANQDPPAVGFPVAFARSYITAGHVSSPRKLLLVPCAYGGTNLVSGYWQKGGVGYNFAVAQANEAMALPDGTNRFKGVLWLQGENDASSDVVTADYAYMLDLMIHNMRTDITGASESWFSLGGMVPEKILDDPAYQLIAAAHVDTPNRVLKSVYWPGSAMGGVSIHYDAPRQRLNGAAAFASLANLSDALVAPGAVTGLTHDTVTSTSVALTWTAPADGSITTDYVIQYKAHSDSAWIDVSRTRSATPSQTASGLQPSTSYDFRVAAKNLGSTGQYSDTFTVSTSVAALPWSSTAKSTNILLTNSDLTAGPNGVGSGNGFNSVTCATGHSSGKRYFEARVDGYLGNGAFFAFGIGATPSQYSAIYPGCASPSWGNSASVFGNSGRYVNGFTNGAAQTIHSYFGVGSIVRFWVDFDAGKLWFKRNETAWQSSQNPETGANPCMTFTPGATYYPACALYYTGVGNLITLIAGGAPTYDPGSFSAW